MYIAYRRTWAVSLYELKREIELLEEIDWSPDEGYIKRIVHCLAGARDLKRRSGYRMVETSCERRDRPRRLQQRRQARRAASSLTPEN